MRQRIKFIADINATSLAESTDDGFVFDYVDIGRVSQGFIDPEPQETSFGDAPSRARRLAQPGDSIVSTVRTYLRAVAQVSNSELPQVFSTGFAVLHPHGDKVVPRYLAYYLQSDHFVDRVVAESVGVSYPAINASDLAALDLELPSKPDQELTADFLDRETAQIDALVTEQRELVKLLEERRSSMIWRLVTKGVRETEMLDSGATWIGSVPSHWAVHRLKNSVASSRSGVWGDEPIGDGTDVRCVRVADFDRPRLRVHDLDITMRSVEPRDLRERGLRDGDLLLEKSGGTARNPVGFVVMYEGSGPAVCSNFVSRVRVKAGQVPRYWLYAHAASYTHRLTQRSVNQTTGIQNLDESAYFNEQFPYPPHDEQVEIADRLDSSTARMDAMIQAANESIALMLERRSALISAAVTGRIDPRTGKEIKEAS